MSPGGNVPMSPSVTLERTIRFEPKGSIEVREPLVSGKTGSIQTRPTKGNEEEPVRKESREAAKGSWLSRLFGFKSKGDAEEEEQGYP